VLGGHNLDEKAEEMAQFMGECIVESGCCLVTGGRAGAGESASQGALKQCIGVNVDPKTRIISLVPEGKSPAFDIGSSIHVGQSYFERRVALIKNTYGAIVIGGGTGTASEVKIGLIEAIMEGYKLIPVSGTGGEADRIYSLIKEFKEPLLNSLVQSRKKAQAIVQRMLMPGNCWYFGVDPVAVHDELFLSNSDPYYHRHVDYFSETEKDELRLIRRKYY
jgi:uncharacterized protein (TIGR00725 family)